MEYANVDDMDFESELDFYWKKYRGKKGRIFRALLKREAELVGIAVEQKKTLVQLNHEMCSKLEEIEKLTGKVSKLKKGRDREKKGQPRTLVKVGDGDQNGKEAVFILPEEVWRMILAGVTDVKDRRSASKVCTLFQRIVDPHKTTFPFDKVIPHVYKYLSSRDILQCRLVCQAWCEGVDGLFENDKSLRPHDDKDDDPRRRPRPPFVSPMQEKGLGRRFSSSSGVLKRSADGTGGSQQHPIFIRMMSDVPRNRNPVVGRNLIIDSQCGMTAEFLEHFGRDIWYLTVHNGDFSIIACIQNDELLKLLLLEQARLLPNLRKLRIVCPYWVCVRETNPEITSAEMLPPAPNLETLQINEAFHPYPLTHPMLKVLLGKYHLQLGRLDLRMEEWRGGASHLEWPNLVELHITICKSLEELSYGFQLGRVPKLRKFGLETKCSVSPSTFATAMELISKLCAATPLNTLRLSGRIWNGWESKRLPSSTRAFAPLTLKTLELEHFLHQSDGNWMASSISWYNFLPHFPFIENLNVFWREPVPGAMRDCNVNEILVHSNQCAHGLASFFHHPYLHFQFQDRRQVVDIAEEISRHIYSGEMYKSNIWELLPRLKVFTFHGDGDVYTREGYERFQKQTGGFV